MKVVSQIIRKPRTDSSSSDESSLGDGVSAIEKNGSTPKRAKRSPSGGQSDQPSKFQNYLEMDNSSDETQGYQIQEIFSDEELDNSEAPKQLSQKYDRYLVNRESADNYCFKCTVIGARGEEVEAWKEKFFSVTAVATGILIRSNYFWNLMGGAIVDEEREQRGQLDDIPTGEL